MRTGQRRRVMAVAVAASLAVVAYLPGTATASTVNAVQQPPPSLRFANPDSQALFGTAYSEALTNLLQTNVISYDPSVYDKSGLMDPGQGIVKAGGGYPQPWTRDASVNSWNAASLLDPSPRAEHAVGGGGQGLQRQPARSSRTTSSGTRSSGSRPRGTSSWPPATETFLAERVPDRFRHARDP